MTGRGRLALLLMSVSMIASAASAQVPQPPTREEVQRVAPGPDTRAPSRLTVEGDVERAPCPLAEPRFAEVTITLSDVAFDNLRGLSPDFLRPAYAEYVGKTVPIATICEIRDRAATMLRGEGYLAAVQVPPQRIENGVVRFDVLMAKLVRIQVRGDAGKSERTIAGYLERLTGDELFNQKAAERYLLLARDVPGYDVRLTLRPAGTVPGEVIGEVTVVKVPFTIDTNVQNYGSKDVGRFGAMVRGEFYDVLGLGDRLTAGLFSTAQTAEQNVVQLGYDMRVGSEGLMLGGNFTYAWTTPDLGPNPGDDLFESHTMLATFEATYPALRTQSANVRAVAGLDVINQDLFIVAAQQGIGGGVGFPKSLFQRDRLRVLFGRIDFDLIDRSSIASTTGYSLGEPRWRIAGSYEFRHGLDVFGASEPCPCGTPTLSREFADPTAGLIRFTGLAEFRPVPVVALVFSPRAQYTRHALGSFEEFSAGNYTIGRGYDPGTIIGDKGIGFQAEIRLGSIAPRSRDSFAIQPYAFIDQGWVWDNDPVRLPGRDLTSAGFGVRGNYGNHSRIDVALAAPLQRAGQSLNGPVKPDARLLVSVTTKLYPW